VRFRDYRWPCAYEADVTVRTQRSRATIVNITVAGASLIDVPRVELGDRIEITFLGRSVPAEVRWVRKGRCGVRFEARLATADVMTIRQSVGGRTGGGMRQHALRELR
jgi:hypothetical protein